MDTANTLLADDRRMFAEEVKQQLRASGYTVCAVVTAASQGPAAANAYPPAAGQLPGGDERILFVDDEAPIAKMGSRILAGLGYRVTTRTSSVEALALFQTKPADFDLVITDMTMPNMSGDELAMALLEMRPDLPVILCTGYSKKLTDASVLDPGIQALVYKPIVKAELAKTLREVLDQPHADI